jgi:hypothetical protein
MEFNALPEGSSITQNFNTANSVSRDFDPNTVDEKCTTEMGGFRNILKNVMIGFGFLLLVTIPLKWKIKILEFLIYPDLMVI